LKNPFQNWYYCCVSLEPSLWHTHGHLKKLVLLRVLLEQLRWLIVRVVILQIGWCLLCAKMLSCQSRLGLLLLMLDHPCGLWPILAKTASFFA
jgi:hypothetical protein